MNGNVNVLPTSRTLSWERTLKTTTITTTRNWSVDDLLRDPQSDARGRQDGRHFHQLFRRLRLRNKRTRCRHGEQENLGTSITCSATGKSKRRKKSIAQSTTCGTGASRICTNGERSTRCSHCVPLYPPQRPAPQREVSAVWREESSGPWRRTTSSLSSSLALAVFWAPWGGVVRRFSQGHGDAHPCIPQVCTEASPLAAFLRLP